MKYRKKQVVIEAIQLSKENCLELLDWVTNSSYETITQCLEIETLEGTMNASMGDYIIKGIQGEFYPCKPDIFEATYEKIEE